MENKSTEQATEQDAQQQHEALLDENTKLKNQIQAQQKVIESQNRLVDVLKCAISANNIKYEAFRMLDEAYRSYDEAFRHLDEANRSIVKSDYQLNEADQQLVKAFRLPDEAFRRIVEAFHHLDEAFHRWNEADVARNEAEEGSSDVTAQRKSPPNQRPESTTDVKVATEKIMKLSLKILETMRVRKGKVQEEIARRVARELLYIKQQGKARVEEIKKHFGLNRSAMQRDAHLMMSKKWIEGEGGPMKRVYILTDEGKAFIE